MAHTLLSYVHERFLMNCMASLSEERERRILACAERAAAARQRACADALRRRLQVSQGWELDVPPHDEHELQDVLLTRGPDEQEQLVRARIGAHGQPCLHVYGGILHVALYPVTLTIAIVFALFEGVSMVRRDVARDFARKTDVPSFGFFGEAFFVCFMFLVFSLISPLCIVPVALSAPLDIILLLLRPCFPAKVRQAVVVFFFPSSLAFTVGATLGMPWAVHCLLGALPSAASNASTHLSFERKHYRTILATLRLCPHLDISNCHRSRTAMARVAVKSVFGFRQDVPGAIVWAFVLQDTKLCRAWAAGLVGPDVFPAWQEPGPDIPLPALNPFERIFARLLSSTDLATFKIAVDRRRRERGQLPPELREQVANYMAFQDIRKLFQEVYPEGVAEAVVRQRTRSRFMQRYPLHVFGGILHVALYPVTFFLALADLLAQVGCDIAERVRQGLREEKVPSYECLFNTMCASFYGLIVVVPMCISFFCLWIVFVVPYDIVVLLLRPCFSARRAQTLTHAALPSSIAFCVAARRGASAACFAHCFLGTLPSKYSITSASSSSEVVAAFRLAPHCRHSDALLSFAEMPDQIATAAAANLFPGVRQPIQARVDCFALLSWAAIYRDHQLLRAWSDSAEKSVTVTVLRMSGDVLWGPSDVPSFSTIADLKKRIKDEALADGGRRKRLRLLLSTPDVEDAVPRELSRNSETLIEFAEAGSVNLLLVLEQEEDPVDWGPLGPPPLPPLIGGEDDGSSLSSSSGSPRVPRIFDQADSGAFGRPGADSSEVQEELTEVQCIYPGNRAFAAVTTSGAVVTWGSQHAGGDSESVRAQLSEGVQQVFSTDAAYAALKADGSVVTWGSEFAGGDSSEVQEQLASGVQHICANSAAFAALKEGGAVVAWGDPFCGGDASDVQHHLNADVSSLCATSSAFAALKAGGAVVSWGCEQGGGDCAAVQAQLAQGVRNVYANTSAFAAVKADGSVVTW